MLEVLISELKNTLARTQTHIWLIQTRDFCWKLTLKKKNCTTALCYTGYLPCFAGFGHSWLSKMKGHFSIEWLSQSSQASASTLPSNSWVSPGRDVPSTSGTASESLPGFYSRWRPENMENQEKHMEPAQSGNSLSTQETESNDNNIIQQHTHGKKTVLIIQVNIAE